jgi:hypothetical protein
VAQPEAGESAKALGDAFLSPEFQALVASRLVVYDRAEVVSAVGAEREP